MAKEPVVTLVHQAEPFQEAELVPIDPALDNLVVLESINLDSSPSGLPSGRRESPEIAAVGGDKFPPGGNEVALSNLH